MRQPEGKIPLDVIWKILLKCTSKIQDVRMRNGFIWFRANVNMVMNLNVP